MMTIAFVDMDQVELEAESGHLLHVDLVLIDTDDQPHPLRIELPALGQLATVFRAIQAKFPGALGGH